MLRDILVYPDPRLRQATKEVTDFKTVEALVADLIETMLKKDGLGLAATQVGAAERIFILNVLQVEGYIDDHGDRRLKLLLPPPHMRTEAKPMVFINPSITFSSVEKITEDEGCLSFPGIFVPITRALRVSTAAFDENGIPFFAEAEGLYSRAIQHEYDHLTGRLMIDLVGSVRRDVIKRKMKKLTRER
jgi:peptide deformylase